MGIQENNLRARRNKNLTRYQRLWRCNSGVAWAGEFLSVKKALHRFKLNFTLIVKPRRVELWPKGTPDSIGFDSIIITPEMVGKRVAVFVGEEVKATKGDRLNQDQINWRDKILVPLGGIHREVREDGTVVESGFTSPRP